MPGRFKPLFVAAGLFLSLTSASAVLAQESRPNIELELGLDRGCNLERDQQAYLKWGLEKIHGIYGLLGQPLNPRQNLKIQLFCQTRAFANYRKLKQSDAYSLLGYYSKRDKELVINARYGLPTALRTIFHEGSHSFLDQMGGNYPNWFNEGLAEYFAFGTPTSQGMVIEPQPKKEARLRQWLSEGTLPELKSFLALSPAHWQEWNRMDLRASSMAWGLLYFLMEKQSSQEMVADLLAPDRAFTYLDDMLHYEYPGGLAQLELDWHLWIQANHEKHLWALK